MSSMRGRVPRYMTPEFWGGIAGSAIFWFARYRFATIPHRISEAGIIAGLLVAGWVYLPPPDMKPPASSLLCLFAGVLFLGASLHFYLNRSAVAQPPKKPDVVGIPTPPAPVPVPEDDGIYQAGIVVGKAFGARRLPNDATRFEFREITNAHALNPAVPIQYRTLTLKLEKAESADHGLSGRQHDGTIYTNVVAVILTP